MGDSDEEVGGGLNVERERYENVRVSFESESGVES